MDDKSLIQIAAMGGVMGLGHVLSPDHLSALATLSAGGGAEAFRLGVRWGLGHSIGMVANSAITTPFTPSVNHSRTGRRRHDTPDGDLVRRSYRARDVW